PDQAPPPADSQATAPDFDQLIDQAEQQCSREHLTQLNRALFALPCWYSVLVRRDGPLRPYVGVVENTPSLLLFTDAARAQTAFALIERLGGADEVQLGHLVPADLVRDAAPYTALGVQRLQFNSRYYLPLTGLRDQYYYVMRPHDFKQLVNAAEADDSALLALWQALFDLPKWFFLVNHDAPAAQPTLIGGEFEGQRVIYLFLSYDHALEQARQLSAERGTDYAVQPLAPAQGYALITDNRPDGVLLRDEGVCAGWKLDKLTLAWQHLGPAT
ncbi:MAG: hypothetical protein PHH58_15990, partial [Rhodoferax sp.]|nr:hypothetical protein [Rhodoferax sp.]